MASPEAAVVDLLRRLKAAEQQQAERRRGGHARTSSIEMLRDTVQSAKDMNNLIEMVEEATALCLAKSSIGDDCVTLLMKALKEGSGRVSNLLQLDLADNGITEKGFAALMKALQEGFPGLEHLNVSHNRIGEKGIAMLATILSSGKHSSLRGLDVSECAIGDYGMLSFAEALQSGKFSSWELQSLDLSANGFRVDGAVALTRAMVMGRLSQLRFLNLSQSDLGEQGTLAFADVLNAGLLSELTHLLLARCSLSDEVIPIARAIEAGNLPSLQALDVSDNHLGELGSAAMAKAFRAGRSTSLRHLSVSRCGIGALEFDGIAKAIEAGGIQGLRFLDLSGNSLDSSERGSMLHFQGSMALARLVKRGNLRELQYLDLSECCMSDDALIAMAETMEASHLTELQQFFFKRREIEAEHEGVGEGAGVRSAC